MLNVPFIVLQMQFLENIGRIASEEMDQGDRLLD